METLYKVRAKGSTTFLRGDNKDNDFYTTKPAAKRAITHLLKRPFHRDQQFEVVTFVVRETGETEDYPNES